MKSLIAVVITAFVLLSGCKTESEIKHPIAWNGESLKDFNGKTMAAMLWIRPITGREFESVFPANYQVYKRFNDDDYKTLLECLNKPEVSKSPNLPMPSGFSILYLSFLDGSHYIIRFSLEHETAILPNGYSKKLYTLFTEKETSAAYDPQKDPTLVIQKSPMMDFY